jgi:glycosidase
LKNALPEILSVAALMMMGAGEAVPIRAQIASGVPAWVKDAVFYQIFPERFANGDVLNDPQGTLAWGGVPTSRSFFGGDLRGIITKLKYLSSLGINAIYLNPIFASSSNHKYNTADYLRIDPAFGDERTFKELVDSCHSRGIRIILDGVFNHTGTDFFAFVDARNKGAKSAYASWYNFHSFPVGPPNKPNYDCWWGHGSLPKLMTGNPEVRKFLFDVTRHWMSLGIDGWRLDVPNEIPHEFWIAWRRLVKSLNPDAYIVGEIWDNGAAWLQGDQFDAVMNYRFRSACVDFFALNRTSVSGFDSILARQRHDYPPEVDYCLLNLLGSHDTERFLTMCYGDVARWKLAVLFQMTYPGAPSVYYGDEVGMSGGKDPGCRGTMVWDPALQNRDLLKFTTDAIHLRRTEEVLRRGTFTTLLRDNAREVYGFLRDDDSSSAIVVLNRSEAKRQVFLPAGTLRVTGEWKQIWPQDSHATYTAGDTLTFTVPERAGIILKGETHR